MNGNNWITPLNKRIKELPPLEASSFVRAGKCVMPVAVYYFLCMFLTFGAAYIIGTGQYGANTSQFFVNHSAGTAIIIRIFVLVLAIIPMFPAFLKENPVFVQNKATGGKDKAVYVLFTIVLAVVLALFLNVIFVKTGISSMSSGYEETSTKQFSLSLWAGLLMYGLCTPVAEEIVYRGLVYNRLRRYFEMPVPLIVAPLLFGVAHGNMVQLLYGFMMGFVICFVYERYGSFIYPVIFHIAANTAVYTVMKIDVLRKMVFSLPGTIFTGSVSFVIFLLISMDAAKKEN